MDTNELTGSDRPHDVAQETELDAFYADLAAAHLHPLWRITRELLTATPAPRAVPWLWPASVMLPLARRALRLVPVDRGGERRVLSLGNPGMPGSPYAAGTLWGAIQCLGPGETAPAHRHSPGAIRFVLSGTGVSTTVDGDACDMYPGDLVLTPSWNWHDHTSTGDGPMFWFDGLDLPMVEALDAVFFEPYPDFRQPDSEPHNRSEHAYGPDRTRYAEGDAQPLDPRPSPLLVYRWADTDAELTRLASRRDEAMVSLEFVNPQTGASVLPTLSCAMHRLAAGGATAPVRRTGNTVVVVFRGSGASVVDGVRMEWSDGDMFVVPSWSAVEHASAIGADLFTLGDAPVLRALGLYREQRLPAPQQVRGTFPHGD
ncbi:cupin domain-containing protein [Rugosimonospora africana]|uniref:Gentisate 1,2-dioxygenase n=1 Tax=Rugosimonospora africana TaxID=556532 RepID=A0A8J3QQ07_9ACTN|nr:cupin domain-containing protein [Rugosimonospora africana]GIH15345.1 gentisate 1,2-dioxygenase [Rugosimonospora africana]